VELESRLLSLYHTALVQNGVKNYPLETLLDDYIDFSIIVILVPTMMNASMKNKGEAIEDTYNRFSDLAYSWYYKVQTSFLYITENEKDFEKYEKSLERLIKCYGKEEVEDQFPEVAPDLKATCILLERTPKEDYSTLTVESSRLKLADNLKMYAKYETEIPIGKTELYQSETFSLKSYFGQDFNDKTPVENVLIYFPQVNFHHPIFNSCENTARYLSNTFRGYAVILVQPRLCPEFTTVFEDSIQALKFIESEEGAKWLGFKPKSGVFLARSFGCNLILNALLKNENLLPNLPIKGVILSNPNLSPNCDNPSNEKIGDKFIYFEASANTSTKFSWKQFTSHLEHIPHSFIGTIDGKVENLPPVLIISGNLDPSFYDTVSLESQLRNAGNDVTIIYKEGCFVEFTLSFNKTIGQQAYKEILEWLTKY